MDLADRLRRQAELDLNASATLASTKSQEADGVLAVNGLSQSEAKSGLRPSTFAENQLRSVLGGRFASSPPPRSRKRHCQAALSCCRFGSRMGIGGRATYFPTESRAGRQQPRVFAHFRSWPARDHAQESTRTAPWGRVIPGAIATEVEPASRSIPGMQSARQVVLGSWRWVPFWPARHGRERNRLTGWRPTSAGPGAVLELFATGTDADIRGALGSIGIRFRVETTAI